MLIEAWLTHLGMGLKIIDYSIRPGAVTTAMYRRNPLEWSLDMPLLYVFLRLWFSLDNVN